VPREGGQQGWVVRRSGRRSFARKLCACTARARSKAAERWAAGFPSLAQYMREHKTSAEHARINTLARLIADLGDETARAEQRAASATSFDLRAITTSSSRSSLSLTNTPPRRPRSLPSTRRSGAGGSRPPSDGTYPRSTDPRTTPLGRPCFGRTDLRTSCRSTGFRTAPTSAPAGSDPVSECRIHSVLLGTCFTLWRSGSLA
jgi:hypothetical protein